VAELKSNADSTGAAATGWFSPLQLARFLLIRSIAIERNGSIEPPAA
jgi:hypothetical protein